MFKRENQLTNSIKKCFIADLRDFFFTTQTLEALFVWQADTCIDFLFNTCFLIKFGKMWFFRIVCLPMRKKMRSFRQFLQLFAWKFCVFSLFYKKNLKKSAVSVILNMRCNTNNSNSRKTLFNISSYLLYFYYIILSLSIFSSLQYKEESFFYNTRY